MKLVLYTPLLDSEIFPTATEENRKYISYEGRTLHVTQLESGEYQLEQLLSTNPQDYLNKNFTPGNVLPPM